MAKMGTAGKPLGSGANFAKIRAKAAASGARNPDAVAAAAGIKAHGKAEMAKFSAEGRRRAGMKHAKGY